MSRQKQKRILLLLTLLLVLSQTMPALAYLEDYDSLTGNQIILRGETVTVSGTRSADGRSTQITIHGRTFTVFQQGSFADDGKTGKFLGPHGCIECSLTTILRAYSSACASWTPLDTVKIAEKSVLGSAEWEKNYNKSLDDQRPITSRAADKILTAYGIKHTRVTNTTRASAKKDIISTLKEGGSILFTVSVYNHATKKKNIGKYSFSFHTMVMVGYRTDGKILVLNPGGTSQVVALDLDDVLNYMWFSNKTGKNNYFKAESGSKGCSYCTPSNAGYIKITEGMNACSYGAESIQPATLKRTGTSTRTCIYCGRKKTETIPKIASVRLSSRKLKSNGKSRVPSVTVRLSNGKLLSSRYYTVSAPAGSAKPGTYQLTVTFSGKYSGSKTLRYRIVR